MIKKNLLHLGLAVLSGLFLAFLFPKFSYYYLAWIALVPLLMAVLRTSEIKIVALEGFLCGFVFFLINLSWLTVLVEFGGIWIYLGWIALAGLQALFIMVFSLIVKKTNNNFLITPLVWVVIEWLRSLGVFGITAGGLGYSQASFLPLLQLASLVSVYGISFVIVMFNASLANVLLRWKMKSLAALVFSMALVFIITIFGFQTLTEPQFDEHSLKLALVQPNIDQRSKLNSSKIPFILKTTFDLSRQSLIEGPDVIIWPETALFTYLLHDRGYLNQVRSFISKAGVPLITGMPDYENDKVYNTILSFSSKGELLGTYQKQRLVAFGEYLPYRPITYPFLRSTGFFESVYSPGKKNETLPLLDHQVGGLICFESTFPALARKHSKNNADFILNLTNDAWFKDSSALEQHFQQGILRAVENRKNFVQVANTGISGVVDRFGRVVARTKANQRTYLTVEIFFP